jgi:hypothetical protein
MDVDIKQAIILSLNVDKVLTFEIFKKYTMIEYCNICYCFKCIIKNYTVDIDQLFGELK